VVKTAFLYTDKYFDYDYGAGHPLKIERLRLTYDLCKAYGLFDLSDSQMVEARPAGESEILRFHSPHYVKELTQASKGKSSGFFPHGLGYTVNVARAWTLAWSIMNAVDLPENLPESMMGYMAATGGLNQKLRDPEHKSARQRRCAQHMAESVRYLEENVFPMIQ